MLILRHPRTVGNFFFLKSFISSFSRAWNPYFFRFILGSRIKKFTVINHVSFYFMLKRAFLFIEALMVRGARGFILNEYQQLSYLRSFMGLTLSKWTPGMLTNIKVLRRLVKQYRLRLLFPFFLMIMGVRLQNVSFLMEAKRLRIPTIAFLNAYFGHWIVDYPILGDTNRRAAYYYTYLFEEMRLLVKSFFLHRYVFRRSKLVYARAYLARSALLRESLLSTSLVSFKQHEKLSTLSSLIESKRIGRRRPQRVLKRQKGAFSRSRSAFKRYR